MTTYWMITTSPKNFEVDRQNNFSVEGFKNRIRETVKKVEVGDRFVLYIQGLQRFGSTSTATSGYFYDDKNRIWIEKDEIWPCRFKTKPDVVLEPDELLDVKKLLPSLSFITPKQRSTCWALPFRGSLKTIPEDDFKLIEAEMRKMKTIAVKTPASITSLSEDEAKEAIMKLDLENTSLHDRIGEMLDAIGTQQGYNSFTRHKITPDHALELDVAWLRGKNPEVAIEVQIGGDMIQAKERLVQAKKFNYRKVIIVTEESQRQRLNDILKFDDLKHWIDAWSLQAIYELYTSGMTFFNLYHQLMDSRYTERTEVDLVYPSVY